MKLRLKGDIHGDIHQIDGLKQDYLNYDLTIQIGDYGIGFGNHIDFSLNEFQSDRFKVLAGNHENYEILAQYPHNLGRFGNFEFGGKNIFFVQGAWSIDYQHRTPGLSWWATEELTMKEADECLDLWEEVKDTIDIVITHDGPPNVTMNFLNGRMPVETLTGKVLWEMWKIKNPPRWLFGHWHLSDTRKLGDTIFQCLNINEEVVIDTEEI